ncbi:MAG: type I-E CRISPR-associated protein Cse1/CasA [Candidatus Tectomicrobia bacterium]|nr:type I-E CRISPR-associated protein Cse1/CasA [Candidatus Tectomicrobia bacterium]
MFNFLCDPLVRLRRPDNTISPASLPEVYAALMANNIDAFPSLRPHQRHAWHSFLVQLAAMALHSANQTELPCDRGEWEVLIRGLTHQFPDDEPWTLIVDEVCKPAFFQPPARIGGKIEEYKSHVATPDELDMLVTSRNHDLKSAVGSQPHMDDWIFSLITLQTMEGFGGAGNYGISRMNGGLGSRPAFTLAPVGGISEHIKRDIKALLGCRQTLLDEGFMNDGGTTLLWVRPWDGTAPEALSIDVLDPYYIEVCRRVRLCLEENGRVYGIRAVSKTARVDARALKGRLGDPWAPIDRRENKCLTLSAEGFSYKRVVSYLNAAEWEWPALLRLTPEEERSSNQCMQIVARGMVRGQGKTEGYHERVVPLKPQIVPCFKGGLDALDLHAIADQRIRRVATVESMLRHAIATFAARGNPKDIRPEHRILARRWSNSLDEIVDSRFFEDLQDEFASKEDEREKLHNDWLRNFVIVQGWGILRRAEDAIPCPALHRYRAREAAEGLFEGRLRGSNGLPFLFLSKNEDNQQ